MDNMLDQAKANRAEMIVNEYARGEEGAIRQIAALLVLSRRAPDDLVAGALVQRIHEWDKTDHLTIIERIEYQIAVSENRRNAILREIDRRRAVLGEALRRNLEEIEHAEFRQIKDASAETENAA
jgi:hypothetical protein